MAKVTKKDKEIISIIFKQKMKYLNIYDEDLELIDFIKELKNNELSVLNNGLKYLSYFGIIYFLINFYINVNSLDRAPSIYYLCNLFCIPAFMTYCFLVRFKGSITTFSPLWQRIIISTTVSSIAMIIFGLFYDYDKVFITCGLVFIIIITLITLPFKRRWKKKDKLFNDIIANLEKNENYLESLITA